MQPTVDQRHYSGPNTRSIPRFLTIEQRMKLVESLKVLTPLGIDPCWSGWCNKCGKPLISATTSLMVATDHFECGICDETD